MKTKEQVLEAIKSGVVYDRDNCKFIDNRDFSRLVDFFPVEQWKLFGFELEKREKAPFKVEKWTKENILKHLESDLAFAFKKALSKRGISSSLMFEVIKMWMWVLDDSLANFSDKQYAMYGLPLYKAVAIKYNLPNPIGNNVGNENEYNG